MSRIELLQMEVCMLPTAVTHHQHRYLLSGKAFALRLTATFSGSARQFALPLEGLQEEGLIGFDDAGFMLRSMLSNQSEKAMAPAERCVLMHLTVFRRLTDRQALDHRLGITPPEFTMP
ncbi:hypothetical protein D9M69_543260 [compost metagenome]